MRIGFRAAHLGPVPWAPGPFLSKGLRLLPEALLDRLFQISPQVRYAAVVEGDKVSLRVRDGFEHPPGESSEAFAERLTNPALLTLATQRGAIDCGGARYLLVRYGHFFQFLRATDSGHVSVSLEAGADVVGLAGRLDALIEKHG